jgi:hypothetical protein
MRALAETIASEWCYPEEHHAHRLVLTYHCVDTSKAARVPRIEVRGTETNEVEEAFIGGYAVDFLAALNEACQGLLR